MKQLGFICAALTLATLFYSQDSAAEPWLANRYAQNCAACHSPSRRNVAPKERRCTLACQGCHVNPSGGGLRNEYGVWNQQRWLRSFKSETLGSKGLPAPLEKQKYGKMPSKLSRKHLNYYKRFAKNGPPLVVTKGVDYELEDYDKGDGQEHIDVATRTEFLARLTSDDPWRIERERSVFAGGDFRYFYFDGESKDTASTTTTKIDGKGPMAFDMGVKVRPTREHFSLVFENRFLNNPNTAGQSSLEWAFTNSSNGSQVRSAYALIDDLPYATFIQYGLYRPMFGHSSPDHSNLLNSMIYSDNTSSSLSINSRAARAVNKVLTIGGSPNVPFINLHWIQPMDNKSFPMGGESGYAANLGGRFVTLGASIMFSYWSTKGKRTNTAAAPELKTDMMGVTAGFTFNRFVVNADFTTIEKEYAVGQTDKGNVQTLEVKYQLWREFYALLNYGTANVNRDLKEGQSNETMYGIKSFLTPGVEFELMMVSRSDRNSVTTKNTDLMQGQLHMYF